MAVRTIKKRPGQLVCPILKAAGIAISNGGRVSDWQDLKTADKIKKICLGCPYPRCVYVEKLYGNNGGEDKTAQLNTEILKKGEK